MGIFSPRRGAGKEWVFWVAFIFAIFVYWLMGEVGKWRMVQAGYQVTSPEYSYSMVNFVAALLGHISANAVIGGVVGGIAYELTREPIQTEKARGKGAAIIRIAIAAPFAVAAVVCFFGAFLNWNSDLYPNGSFHQIMWTVVAGVLLMTAGLISGIRP